MLNFLIYLAIGRIIIWFTQITDWIVLLAEKTSLTKKLVKCDLCLGVWVYLFLWFIIPQPLNTQVPIFEPLFVALVSSLMMHLLRIGWTYKFGVLTE